MFFYIIEQAIKPVSCARAETSETESPEGAESQSVFSGWGPPGPTRQSPSVLPLLSLAPASGDTRVSVPLFSLGRAALRASRQRPRAKRAKFGEPGVSLRAALATPPDSARSPSSLEKSCSGHSPPPRPSLAPLESGRRRWRASLWPRPRSPARPPPASRAPCLPLPAVRPLEAGAAATGTGSGGRGVQSGAGDTGDGESGPGTRAGAGQRPRLTERTPARRGCRWWSPPP